MPRCVSYIRVRVLATEGPVVFEAVSQEVSGERRLSKVARKRPSVYLKSDAIEYRYYSVRSMQIKGEKKMPIMIIRDVTLEADKFRAITAIFLLVPRFGRNGTRSKPIPVRPKGQVR